MKIPEGMTESQVVEIINKVVNQVAPSFKFAYFDIDDIKQEAKVLAIEGMESYDSSRPLMPFLYRHIKNRLINLVRNKYRRNDPPCSICYKSRNDISTPHADGKFCQKYLIWQKRNNSKRNIMIPVDITTISDEHESRTRVESRAESDVEIAEILELIDEKLDVELRAAYLQMRAGEEKTVSKTMKDKVMAAIHDIIKDLK